MLPDRSRPAVAANVTPAAPAPSARPLPRSPVEEKRRAAGEFLHLAAELRRCLTPGDPWPVS